MFYYWPLKFKPGMVDSKGCDRGLCINSGHLSSVIKTYHGRFFWLQLEGISYLNAYPLFFPFY